MREIPTFDPMDYEVPRPRDHGIKMKRPLAHWIRWLIGGVLFVTVSALPFLPGCEPAPNLVPKHLVGAWKTQAPGYANRVLEFTKYMVRFGTGDVTSSIYFVEDIEEHQVDRHVLYDITYTDFDREEYKLLFYYRDVDGGQIIFKNQTHLKWNKQRS